MRGKDIIFHFIILGTIIGVFALGVWQLQRREWKHDLIAIMDRNLILPATPMPENLDQGVYWRQVEISPQVDAKKTIYVPRFHNHTWGYEIYALTGENILRLGWAQQKLSKNPQHIGIIRVIIRPFDHGMNFMGTALKEDEKPHADASLYTDFNLKSQNYYLDAVDEISPDIISLWHKPDLPDNHLQYAMTWFALAAVLSALYLYKIHHDRRN